MKLVIWLLFVLPFTTIVWFYDIIQTGICLIYNYYYLFASRRSAYLRDRLLLNAMCKESGNDNYKNFFDYKN